MKRPLAALDSKSASLWAIALGLLLALPNLRVGFFADDYSMLAILDGNAILQRPFYDLYRFATPASVSRVIAQGAGPWWGATDLHIHLLRPLSSVLLALDHRLFGSAPFGYHLHSLGWLVLHLFALRAVFRRMLSPAVATLALVIAALSTSLAVPAGWISARQLLISGSFCAGALAMLPASTSDLRRRCLVASMFSLALLGGEAGLGGIAFWFFFELVQPNAIYQRLTRLTWPVALGLLYCVLYRVFGGGVRGSGVYVEPFSSPLEFARLARVRVPILFGDITLGIPGELSSIVSHAPLVLAGVFGTAIVAWPCWRFWSKIAEADRLALRWLIPGASVATFAASGGFVGSRLLVVPMIGFAPILAISLHLGAAEVFRSRWQTMCLRGTTGLIALAHLVIQPLAVLGDAKNRHAATRQTTNAVEALLKAETKANRVLILAASDPMIWLYAGMQLAAEHPGRIQGWCVVSATRAEHRVMRVADRQLSIEPIGTTFLTGEFERLFRTDHRLLNVGDEVSQCGVIITVSALKDRRPSRLAVTFERDLADPTLAVLAWHSGQLRRVALGAVGTELRLKWSPGPMQFF